MSPWKVSPGRGGCCSERSAPAEASLIPVLGRAGHGLLERVQAELSRVVNGALLFLLQEKPKGVDNLALEP